MSDRKKNINKFVFHEISPDEIFLDARNIPNFDSSQFEGRMEKPIGSKVFLFLTFVFSFLGLLLLARVGYLQIVRGEEFSSRARDNHLRILSLQPERGFIYDRGGELLAWNDSAFNLVLEKKIFGQTNLKEKLKDFLKTLGKENSEEIIKIGIEGGQDLIVGTFYDWSEVNDVYLRWSFLPLKIEPISLRAYKADDGLAHVIGYMGFPSNDDLRGGVAFDEGRIGKAGVEKSFEKILRGENGVKVEEVDSSNQVKSESVQKVPVSGESLSLSVDYRVQEQFYNIISGVIKDRGFQGGAGVIMDVDNGQILTMVSYPEYSSQVLTRGGPGDLIQHYLADVRTPFINRAISGLYAPGSIIKPFIAVAALSEKVISPDKQILSSGSISLPNPYVAGEESIFYDWKAHGWVDMRRALAVSSNVYFYTVGGGYGDVGGLGIKRISQYLQLFGLGSKTGIDLECEENGFVPNPGTEKTDSLAPVWRIGDTYNASIGQGYIQVTPLQMAGAVAIIANGGNKVAPEIILGRKNSSVENLGIDRQYFQIVKEGMRQAVLAGTAGALGDLPIELAAKTGTAELGVSKKSVNSWLIGFWPYEKPRYAISVVLEKGSSSNLIGGVFVVRQLMEWMFIHTPEYLKTID